MKNYTEFQLYVITYLCARELKENPSESTEERKRVNVDIFDLSKVTPVEIMADDDDNQPLCRVSSLVLGPQLNPSLTYLQIDEVLSFRQAQ